MSQPPLIQRPMPASEDLESLRRKLLETYPGADLLPFDTEDPYASAVAVAARGTGDKLFEFLWTEIGEVQDPDASFEINATAAIDALRNASEQIAAVEAGIAAMIHARSAKP